MNRQNKSDVRSATEDSGRDIFKNIVEDQSVSGLTEVVSTAAEVDRTKNELSRTGGFAPAQWVLGRLPRVPGSQYDEDESHDMGALANTAGDGSNEFSRQAAIRASSRLAFAQHDVGRRTARALLRKAAPLIGW